MKIVFLDIDGVLNCEKFLQGFRGDGVIIDPARMSLLKQIVDATDAEIVLSSSWREHWNKEFNKCDATGKQINTVFSEFDLHVFDKTPKLGLCREREIENWLNEHPNVKDFVVLDDSLLRADFLDGHFVKTSNYFEGLEQSDVEKAIGILNPDRKLFVVSDVHGHCSLLKEALEGAGFNDDNPQHLLICCGDYFDRGNENVEVLKFFERLKHKVLLRGNHEDLLLKLLETGEIQQHNRINGTIKTLENFFGKYAVQNFDGVVDFSGQWRTVDRICDFINETINFFETENYVFVHGWLPNTSKEWRFSSDDAWEKARWIKWTERYDGTKPIENKTLICGHMPTLYAFSLDPTLSKDNSDIFYGNGLIAIDAGTCDTKKVNVLVLEDRLI